MSAVLDDGDSHQHRAQLGTLLVERGLLTEAQLALALAEQQTSGLALGEILIALGFVPAATIAQALATQHGSLLKTEYGFATGFGSTMPAGSLTEPPPAPAAPLEIVPAPPREVPAPAPLPVPVPIDLPPAAAAPAPVDAELERRLDAAVARVGALVAERDALAATLAEREASLEPLQAELAAARAELAAVPAERPAPALSVDAETFTGRIVELEDALVVELARKGELEAAVTERDERLRQLEALVREQPWASSERHLLFFHGPTGYALSEHDGPPPLPGARIEVAGAEATQVVTRVAPAPLPGHALPCAYLVAA
ncbi:MAG TPA: hypothetical protein VII51_02610 [Gaiellaceae bacterium]